MATRTSRRDFLRASVLTGAIFGADKALIAEETREAGENSGQARNVIMMVSDGMNHGALALSHNYQKHLLGRTANWTKMYRELPVVRSLMETWSANSVVTDSSAASSSWGGGARVNNGSLNVSPEGRENKTLHQKVQETGRRTGLVTTATFTHATPAGFATNQLKRSAEDDIARQYLDRRVQVLLGGGKKFLNDQLAADYRAAGYDLAGNRQELLALPDAPGKPLIGTFDEGYMPFAIDRANSKNLGHIPSLPEMSKVALNRLKDSPDGFFLMIEGARIDHAGHANDAASSIHEQIEFDETIGLVLEFLGDHPDTLLIITTDHGCGGIQLNGRSGSATQGFDPGIYGATTKAFDKIAGFTRSLERMKNTGINALSGDKLRDMIKLRTGLELDDEEVKKCQGLKSGAVDVFARHHAITWTGDAHTSDLVEFCALGPGSSAFPAFLENREVHSLILKAFGIS